MLRKLLKTILRVWKISWWFNP